MFYLNQAKRGHDRVLDYRSATEKLVLEIYGKPKHETTAELCENMIELEAVGITDVLQTRMNSLTDFTERGKSLQHRPRNLLDELGILIAIVARVKMDSNPFGMLQTSCALLPQRRLNLDSNSNLSIRHYGVHTSLDSRSLQY